MKLCEVIRRALKSPHNPEAAGSSPAPLPAKVEAVDVQNFSTYVDYLKKYVLSYEAKRKSKLLQSQDLFCIFSKDISSDKTLKIPHSETQMIYGKFIEYVNLKDCKAKFRELYA
jgi:hypothetical protein